MLGLDPHPGVKVGSGKGPPSALQRLNQSHPRLVRSLLTGVFDNNVMSARNMPLTCPDILSPQSTGSREVADRAAIELLPVELIGHIANLLPLDDFGHLRLASRSLARANLTHLALPEFKGLPWRKDARRLSRLSKIPQCARRIRSISFNLARLDEEAALINSFSLQQSLFPNGRPENVQADWIRYFEKERAGKKTPPLRLKLVLPAISRLPNLDSVALSWTECPWEIREIDQIFDPESSADLAKTELIKTTQAVLETLRERDVPLKRLTLEPLPLRKLRMPPSLDTRTQNVFGSLRHLGLVLYYEGDAYYRVDRLEHFLSYMPRLKSLRIHMHPAESKPDHFPFLPNTTLTELEELDLTCLDVGLLSFEKFLGRHARTLKRLDLMSLHGLSSNLGTEERNWDMVFHYMHDKLKWLEGISLGGRFSCWERGSNMFYKGDEPGMMSIYEDLPWAMESRLMEDYILEGGGYPQPSWDMR